jgi:hypothetical protein
MKGRENLGELGADEKIILKQFLNIYIYIFCETGLGSCGLKFKASGL